MKILVTGCNGQLGRAINEVYKDEIASGEIQLINSDFGVEGAISIDITDLDAVRKIVADEKPDVIINCAAYTNVNAAESDEDTAYRINAIGPKNLAIVSKEADIKLVHVSTDSVFDRPNTVPYV